jgi:hypothetical protein
MVLTTFVELDVAALFVFLSALGVLTFLACCTQLQLQQDKDSSSSSSLDVPGFPRIFQLQTTCIFADFSGGWIQATGPK